MHEIFQETGPLDQTDIVYYTVERIAAALLAIIWYSKATK
jgi:hypothetical protein